MATKVNVKTIGPVDLTEKSVNRSSLLFELDQGTDEQSNQWKIGRTCLESVIPVQFFFEFLLNIFIYF